MLFNLGDKIGRHRQQHIDTAGFQLEKGGRGFGDLAECQVFELGRTCVLGHGRAPGVIVVAHQNGLLADVEAFQLVGPCADGFGHAKILAHSDKGFGFGHAHDGKVVQQVRFGMFHHELHRVFIHNLNAVDGRSVIGVVGAVIQRQPVRDGLRIEGHTVVEGHTLFQVEHPRHAVLGLFPAFCQMRMIAARRVHLDQPVEDQKAGSVRQNGRDRVIACQADRVGRQNNRGLLRKDSRSRCNDRSDRHACGQQMFGELHGNWTFPMVGAFLIIFCLCRTARRGVRQRCCSQQKSRPSALRHLRPVR